MKITVYSSGSAGNCTLVQTKKYNILVDAGIGIKSIESNLALSGLSLKEINILLITHEHTDHIKAFNSLLKYENIVNYISKGTYDWVLASNKNKAPKMAILMEKRVNDGSIILLNRIEKSIFYPTILLEDLQIQVLPTFHDAVESIAFVIDDYEKKLVYITDTGYVHQSLYEAISNADAYILESNHDPAILMHSSRPYVLKRRILSDHGHMSNEDSMLVLAHCMGEKTKLVMHAHISQECNLTQIVELTRKKVFDDFGLDTSGIEFVITGPFRLKEYEI